MTAATDKETVLTDFTDKEIGALKLGCHVVRISEQAGALPPAQSALALHLADALAHLAAYKQRADAAPLAAWPSSCPRLFAVELPPGCVRRAAQLPLPSQPTIEDVDAHMRRARELALQVGRATVVSAAHATHGCNRARDCIFCFNE